MESIFEILKDSIPSDHCHQSRAIDIAAFHLRKHPVEVIVDIGCGTGSSSDAFRKLSPSSRWVGIDIEASPEVLQRTRSDVEFRTFDGVNLPFEDDSVDLLFSNQVLEHVRHPEPLLREIRRVMRRGAMFIGQVSQLEPYHSFSYWNFTVFGFKVICEDAGLIVKELRPGIDGITLIQRSYMGRPKEYSRWFSEESPLNIEIERTAKLRMRGAQAINFRKLMTAGQFCFACSAA